MVKYLEEFKKSIEKRKKRELGDIFQKGKLLRRRLIES